MHLYTADRRMLELMYVLKLTKAVRSEAEFCRIAGMQRQNIKVIKIGTASFTSEQIEAIGKRFNINYNWVFGIESNVYRGKKNTPALNKLLHRVRNGATYNATKKLQPL